MMYFRVLATEFLKLRRTKITWVLGLVYCIAPLMMALMMAVLRNPELGRRLGLVTAKAELTIGTADWPTYLTITAYLFAGGLILFGIIQAFVFGREYVEGTAKNMLALPTPRFSIVAAKLTVAAVWFLCIAAAVYVEAIALGLLIGLPGFDVKLLEANVVVVLRLAVQVVLLSSVPAWIAVAARGYLAPAGLSILLLLVGDLFSHTGWGPWVPWSIILLTAGASGSATPTPGPWSTVVLLAVFVAGAVGAFLSLDRTDNTQ